MKTCSACSTEKPLDDFSTRGKIGYRGVCKVCANEYNRMKSTSNRRAWHDILGDTCSRCGYNESIHALEFHHIDPDQKLFMLSSKLPGFNPVTCSRANYASIMLEASKCELICSNCHRVEHAIEN
jgi:hypothetical protein